MSDKPSVLEAIRRLPEEVTLREIRDQIDFLAAVSEGEQQANQGRLIPLEQVETTDAIIKKVFNAVLVT